MSSVLSVRSGKAERAASAADGAEVDVSSTLLRLIQSPPLKGTGLVLREEANASNMKRLSWRASAFCRRPPALMRT